MPTPPANIRNFCIIAHIDHGKSTLADQFLLKTGTISERDIKAQTLDSMDLERERGITIRMHPVTIYYDYKGQHYELNLIDTPGHVDFNYEVSRSLAACEGAILLVDAFQGVQAQTVANAFLAMDSKLTIIPTLNKIDLPHARPDFVIGEMEQAVLTNPDDVMRVSAKAGIGIEDLLGAVIDRIPAPAGDPTAPVKALIYNSHFDTYKGVVVYIRMMEGSIRPGQRMRLMRTGREYVITEMGQFRPGHGEVRRTVGRASRLLHRQHQDHRRRQHRRYRHRRLQLHRGTADRVQGTQADGLFRALPGQQQRVRGPARGTRQAQAQRQFLHLPAGSVGRSRFRLPLRLPRHVAPRDHPAAARARLRPQPRANRPQRHLRNP